jgi:hypothetical protein
MIPERLERPALLVAVLLPIFYGVMIYVTLVGTIEWLVITGIFLVVLFLIVYSRDYPLATVWPIFPSSFLIVGATVALYQGVPGPLTQTSAELVVAYLLAALYIIWGVRSTKNALAFLS